MRLANSVIKRASRSWRVVASQLMRRAVRQPSVRYGMRTLSRIGLFLLSACSPPSARDAPASGDSRPPDTVRAAPAYRITSVVPQIPDKRVPQVWVTLPSYLPEHDIVTIANRVRDSVATVHPDLWAIELLFQTRDTVLDERVRVAEFTWGPNGEKDLSGELTAPRRWSSHYYPSTRHSVLRLLSDYSYSFGEERATVVALLGPPDSVTTGPGFGADTTFTLTYPDAVFQLRHWNADHVGWMVSIRMWGALPDLPPVVFPGVTTRADLVDMLGSPWYRPRAVADTTIWTYDGGGWAQALISFYMVRDTVRVIRWRFHMG